MGKPVHVFWIETWVLLVACSWPDASKSIERQVSQLFLDDRRTNRLTSISSSTICLLDRQVDRLLVSGIVPAWVSHPSLLCPPSPNVLPIPDLVPSFQTLCVLSLSLYPARLDPIDRKKRSRIYVPPRAPAPPLAAPRPNPPRCSAGADIFSSCRDDLSVGTLILFSSRVEGGPGEQIRSDRCKAGGVG